MIERRNRKQENMKMKSIILNNKIMKQFIIVLIGLVMSTSLIAQQTPLSNFYNFNEYLINPAEAGFKNRLDATASHRIQWQGLEGAPVTTFFGAHGALNDKMGIGAKIVVDKTDILKQFNAALSYAYRIKINEKARLNFGLSAMMVQNSVGYGDAVIGDLADEVINGGTESGISFDSEAGIMLEYGKGKFGIASSHLFESGVGYNLPDDRGTATFERVRQFSIYSSYNFKINDTWNLEPFLLMRNQGVESFQFELNALSSWKETLYLGAGYRQEAGIIGRVGFQITDQIIAAYAYEFSGTGVASYSNGSHEFMLGYKIARKAKKAEVVKKEITPEPVVQKIEEQVIEPVKEKIVEPVKEEIKEVVPPPAPPVVEKQKAEPVVEKKTINKSVFNKKIVFSFEGAQIPDNIKKDLDIIAKELKEHPEERVRIEGHTCDMGNDAVNTKYSNKRANIVKSYLLSKGVSGSQMETKAMLDREPLVPNTSLENRKINRRAEIELID